MVAVSLQWSRFIYTHRMNSSSMSYNYIGAHSIHLPKLCLLGIVDVFDKSCISVSHLNDDYRIIQALHIDH